MRCKTLRLGGCSGLWRNQNLLPFPPQMIPFFQKCTLLFCSHPSAEIAARKRSSSPSTMILVQCDTEGPDICQKITKGTVTVHSIKLFRMDKGQRGTTFKLLVPRRPCEAGSLSGHIGWDGWGRIN